MQALLLCVLAGSALLPLAATLARTQRRPVLVALPLPIAAAIAVLALLLAPAAPPPPPNNRPLVQPGEGYVGSSTCRSCHPGEHATWHQSFHRTMTQPATRATVLPQFDRLELDNFGDPVRLEWRDDELWAEVTQFQPAPHRVARPVVQLTGSHHAQVFWYSSGNQRELGLVPMVWRIQEQRWLPFSAVFLIPPEARQPPPPGTWNGNCNSCHATNSQPRLDIGRTDTFAGELGIACEACHGPGEAHARQNRSPLRRYAQRGAADPTIVEPRRLIAARSVEVCGQCHSNSIVKQEHFDYWRDHGSPFRPGQVLAASQRVVDPTQIDAPELRERLQQDPQFFAGKFWPDGDSRLTGRELHGLLRSPCYQHGKDARTMTCLSCHRLHQDEADVRPTQQWAATQLDQGRNGNDACLQCHPQLAAPTALTAHTHHAAASPGSLCYDCHMPHTTYGLLKAVRSHSVDSPDVARELATGRPNACNLCHLDRTLQWTDDHLQQWYGRAPTKLDDTAREIAAGPRWLLAGDAAVRALAAWSAGYAPARAASGTDWLQPYLGQLLADPYVAVRVVAHRSLGQDPAVALDGYDALQPTDVAARTTERLQKNWRARTTAARPELFVLADGSLAKEPFLRLFARRDDRPVYLAE